MGLNLIDVVLYFIVMTEFKDNLIGHKFNGKGYRGILICEENKDLLIKLEADVFKEVKKAKKFKGIKEDKVEETGSTLPIFMSKADYLRVGGWDESYPGAWVVDWEFFLKCELSGMKMMRSYKCNFYHFVSIGTEATPEEKQSKAIKERACHEYFHLYI